ncbi:hypothetical protein TrVE_jg5205 [Triparma verrucosa]|uniref:sphingolipid 4-desaturase n=1 Tax=Triparma verrucosa TaxID=1606542 RepID=A0A9W6ZCC8_9STRA|nr:hypothetical protein TrVE_jg5205 [Triparma verrucosa]
MCVGPEKLKKGSPTEDDDTVRAERAKVMAAAPGFYWDTYTDEPHASRRAAIVKAHPEIKKLFGHCPLTKWKVLASVMIQLMSIHLLQDASWGTWFFCCYTLSGAINHMMTLAMHELSHNLGAKKQIHNRFLGFFANLPMGIPASASFKRYHMEHHRYQGEDVLDVDIPTAAEGQIFTNTPLKIIWCFLQPAFYSLRPLFVNPKDPGFWEKVNITIQVAFDLVIYNFYGFKGLLYLVFGTLLGMGIHPVAGHFIAEHYVMNKGQETYSYYGCLNWLTFNVGYHNEHHDFPFIPGSNLPKVRAIAPEFYDELPHYHSWSKVIVDYIWDPEVGPFARIKRVTVSDEEKKKLKDKGGLVK